VSNKQRIKDFFHLVYNEKDYERGLTYLTPSFFDHSPASSRSGQDAIEAVKSVHEAFPDLQVEIIDLIEEDDKVLVQALFKGTQAAPYLNIENKGNSIKFFALEMYRFNKVGKIIESWGYWPNDAIISQLEGEDSNENIN